jgi:hypothetical protein
VIHYQGKKYQIRDYSIQEFRSMQEKFTIQEIKNYILSQDSLGDVLYNLKAENIIKANTPEEDKEDEMP